MPRFILRLNIELTREGPDSHRVLAEWSHCEAITPGSGLVWVTRLMDRFFTVFQRVLAAENHR